MELPEKSWTFDNWQDEMSGNLTDNAWRMLQTHTPSQLGSLVEKLRNWKVCCWKPLNEVVEITSNLKTFELLKIARKTQQFQAFQLIFPSFRYVQLDFPNQLTRQTIQRWRTIYSISFYGRIVLWMDATVSKGLFIFSLCFTIDGKHMFYFDMEEI